MPNYEMVDKCPLCSGILKWVASNAGSTIGVINLEQVFKCSECNKLFIKFSKTFKSLFKKEDTKVFVRDLETEKVYPTSYNFIEKVEKVEKKVNG